MNAHCSSDEYGEIYLQYVIPQFTILSLSFSSPVLEKGDNESMNELSQTEPGVLATLIPKATPLGRTVPTIFTLITNLSIRGYSVQNLPSPSDQIIVTASYKRSNKSFHTYSNEELQTRSSELPIISQTPTQEEMTLSIVPSMSVVSVSISITQIITVTLSFIQYSSTWIETYIEVPVDIPIYITVYSPILIPKALYDETTNPGLSRGLLIGIVTGAAFILALITGLILFVVKKNNLEKMSSTSSVIGKGLTIQPVSKQHENPDQESHSDDIKSLDSFLATLSGSDDEENGNLYL